MEIRQAAGADLEAVLSVERAAFATDGEAELVRDLLDDPTARPTINLLALDGDRPVGHVLMTRVSIEGHDARAMILAPLAVIPKMQGRGVGGELTRAALGAARKMGIQLVLVLGHPDYYPRHGFTPAGVHGIEPPYPIEERNAGAWMVQELEPGILDRVKGKVRAAEKLMRPEYWRE
jgi:putative acetyltransferase